MKIKIDNSKKVGNSHIKIMYPGQSVNGKDTGFATLGRIDQAIFPPGAIVPMHPHINDEILTYLRSGKVKHTDSEGFSEFIEPTRLMLMKAGKSFYHEEKVLIEGGTLEALQIFIRPKEKDLKPEVIFYELDKKYSENEWRLIASPIDITPLQFSSNTWIYDMKADDSTRMFQLPLSANDDDSFLLYAFDGAIKVNNGIILTKGESLLIKNEAVSFIANPSAELVLFITNEHAAYYAEGMYSGNQLLQ
jgi:redox-sensitive bicupin YhaK (pirin superfamily)